MIFMLRKIYKVYFCLLLYTLTVSTLFSLTVFCEEPLKTYYIDEVPLEITLPEKLITFSRDIDENDPNLEKQNTTKSELEEKYREYNIYLDSISPNSKFEITVSIKESKYTKNIYDLNTISEKRLNSVKDSLLKSHDNYTSCELFGQKYTKFLKSNLTTVNNHVLTASLDYYTIINGKSVNITFHSSENTITDEESNFFESVISNVKFTDIKEKPLFSDNFLSGLYIISTIAILALLIFPIFKIVIPNIKERQNAKAERQQQLAQFKQSGLSFKPIHSPRFTPDSNSVKAVNSNFESSNNAPPKVLPEPKKNPNREIKIDIHYYD